MFKPLFKALALFPYGASVELWRLSGLLKPIVTRLNIKRKVGDLSSGHLSNAVRWYLSLNQNIPYPFSGLRSSSTGRRLRHRPPV
jgi:hypothetical protein